MNVNLWRFHILQIHFLNSMFVCDLLCCLFKPVVPQIPIISHFVSLSAEALNIDPISVYEVERMFVMPQSSKSLARLMTTLLR